MPQHLKLPAMLLVTTTVRRIKIATMRGMLLTHGAIIGIYQKMLSKSVKMARLLGRLGLTPWSS